MRNLAESTFKNGSRAEIWDRSSPNWYALCRFTGGTHARGSAQSSISSLPIGLKVQRSLKNSCQISQEPIANRDPNNFVSLLISSFRIVAIPVVVEAVPPSEGQRTLAVLNELDPSWVRRTLQFTESGRRPSAS